MKYILCFAFLMFGMSSFALPSIEEMESTNAPEPVTSMIWRSGRPTPNDYEMFLRQGIKIIINLEDNVSAIKQDAALAQRAGMKFYSFPMDAEGTPTDQMMTQILTLLKNPQIKTLVHCHHGQDRTGLVIGLERVFIENWTPQKAYQEMLIKKFHPKLKGLDNYFREKTKSRLR